MALAAINVKKPREAQIWNCCTGNPVLRILPDSNKKEKVWESTERNLKLDWAITLSRFEGVAINEHFLLKACFSTLRGESVRKHLALMAING